MVDGQWLGGQGLGLGVLPGVQQVPVKGAGDHALAQAAVQGRWAQRHAQAGVALDYLQQGFVQAARLQGAGKVDAQLQGRATVLHGQGLFGAEG
ncbi:hypothetical protein D3C76_1674530 [compost metagenome]